MPNNAIEVEGRRAGQSGEELHIAYPQGIHNRYLFLLFLLILFALGLLFFIPVGGVISACFVNIGLYLGKFFLKICEAAPKKLVGVLFNKHSYD